MYCCCSIHIVDAIEQTLFLLICVLPAYMCSTSPSPWSRKCALFTGQARLIESRRPMCPRSSARMREGAVLEHELPTGADLGRPTSGLGAPVSPRNEISPGKESGIDDKARASSRCFGCLICLWNRQMHLLWSFLMCTHFTLPDSVANYHRCICCESQTGKEGEKPAAFFTANLLATAPSIAEVAAIDRMKAAKARANAAAAARGE